MSNQEEKPNSEQEALSKQPHFIYEPGMTLAERIEARKEQLQNLRDQRELASLDQNLQRLSQGQLSESEDEAARPRKTKEDLIEDVRKEERELLEKEYQVKDDLRKLSEEENFAVSTAHELRQLLDGLAASYRSIPEFDGLNESIQTEFRRIEESIQEDELALQRERNKVIDQQDEAYSRRLRLLNSKDEEENNEH